MDISGVGRSESSSVGVIPLAGLVQFFERQVARTTVKAEPRQQQENSLREMVQSQSEGGEIDRSS